MNAFHRTNILQKTKLKLIIFLIVLLAIVGLFVVAPARAADTRGGDQVLIGRSEVIEDDLYVAARTVTIDGTIKGDLVAVGSQITINGTIEGDVLAAAQAVVINGVVADDLRAGGQAILLGPNARVGGDLAIGGMSLESQAGSLVHGDLLVGAYQALLAGQVGQRVLGQLDRLDLRGTVGGDVDVTLGGDSSPSAVQFSPAGPVPIPSVPPNLTLAESARIGGKLTYKSSTEATIDPAGRAAGGIAFDQLPATPATATESRIPGLYYLQRLAALLLIGLLILWLTPAWMGRLADTVQARPLPSLAWGLVAFVAFVSAVLAILILTIMFAIAFGYLKLGGLSALAVGLGMLINATLVIGYVTFVAYIAQIVLAYVVGRWLLQLSHSAWAEWPLAALVVGLLVYIGLTAIPWLGTLVGLVVVLLALGALWDWGRARIQRIRPTRRPVTGFQTA